MSKSMFSEPCKKRRPFCPSGPKVLQNPAARGGEGSGQSHGVDLPRPPARALSRLQKSKHEFNSVWNWFRPRHGRLCSDLEPPWAPSEAAKVVISLGTSFKNALIEKRRSETIPRSLLDRSYSSFDLQEGLKQGPQSDPQTLVWAQNTVNNGVFEWFHYFSFLFCIS